MPSPIKLKATSTEGETYSVKDDFGNELFKFSADEEGGRGTVYDNKKNPVLELRID